MRFAALLPFALASIHAASARAGVIDVPGDQPTIAAAVSAASNGDTIRLAKGRHQEAVSTTKSLKFVGKPGAIWDGFFAGAQHSQLLATANQVSVRGIEFQNGDEVVTVVGEDAAVLDCTFRSGFYAVRITGARARVASNRILTMQGSDYMIDIVGQNARVEKNVMLDGYYAGIQIDALGLGTALVANNLMDTTQDDLEIVVANANAPKILRNRLRNGFSVDQCIDVTNCDDAEVRANRIENVNYGVANGIFVQGARALVASNVLDGIENNTGTLTCIEVAGSNATVTKNLVRDCCGGAAMQTNGVLISGQRGRVEQNRFQGLGGGGNDTTAIWLIGDDGRAVSNVIDRFQDSSTFGVYVTGERAAIVNNRITRLMDSYVIHVGGDDFTITGNRISDCAAGSLGIHTQGSASAPGSARIERNTITNVSESGIDHAGNGVTIRKNRVSHVLIHGFKITGNINRLESNTVVASQDDGFHVDGGANELRRCTALACGRDGIDISSGPGNILDRCRAIDCTAEGFDNGGTATVATKCTFKGSRIDYAGNNNVANDAGTSFNTGGPTTAPEVD